MHLRGREVAQALIDHLPRAEAVFHANVSGTMLPREPVWPQRKNQSIVAGVANKAIAQAPGRVNPRVNTRIALGTFERGHVTCTP